MFQTNLNGRIILIITAVTLSVSFLSDPSIPVRIRDLKELEKPFKHGRYTHEDQLENMMKEVFLRKNETDGWHTFAYYVGLVCAWPVGDRYGRKRGILYSNFFRFIAVILHFAAILASIYSNNTAIAHDINNDRSTTSSNSSTITARNVSSNHLLISFSLSSKLADGFYSGLTTVLGVLYVYEISPKSASAPRVGSLSIMGVYMLMKSAADYIVLLTVPPLEYSSINYEAWVSTGLFMLLAGLLQVLLLLRYCPEPASYLAVQDNNAEEAKHVLTILRGTDDVTDELEEIQRDEPAREFLKRSMFLMSLYLVYALYNGVFMFMGFAHGIKIGVNLETSVNAYLIVNIASFLIPILFFDNQPIGKIKEILFSYYFLLGSLYFVLTVMISINLYLASSLFRSNLVIAWLIVVVSSISATAYFSGPGILTTVLVMEYASQTHRTKNLILSWISGIIVTSKAVAFFSLIFIKALFLYYVVFQTFPWVFLFCITWFVWKFETVGYGARMEIDGNANFQADRNANKQNSESSNA